MRKENQYKKSNNNSLLGLLIILFGILLLIDNIIPNLHFINRLFSWPIILIACGLIIGYKSRYENPASYLLIIIGVFFFALHLFNIDFSILFWPLLLIVLGFTLITGNIRRNRFQAPTAPSSEPTWDKRVLDESGKTNEDSSAYQTEFHDEINENTEQNNENPNAENQSKVDQQYTQDYAKDEYIDSTSVFSSNKINVTSKNFKGGNVINIFAGTEINLVHADINEPAVLEVVQLFGESKIIIPRHWVVQPEMAAFFGDIEDKRFTNAAPPDSSKVLYIRGTSLFGKITIKSN